MNNLSAKTFKVDERKLLIVFITILAITGFQVYWLRDSYFREKKALEIKANGLFMETARQVQDSMWQKKLRFVVKDSLKKGIITQNRTVGFVHDIEPDKRTAKAASLVLQKMMSDSLKNPNERKSNVLVSIRRNDNNSIPGKEMDIPYLHPDDIKEIVVVNGKAQDSVRIEAELQGDKLMNTHARGRSVESANTLFFNDEKGRQIVITLDSLFNDSLSIPQLTTEFAKVINAENIDVPFSIATRSNDSVHVNSEIDMPGPRFPFGFFGKYQLQLGNAFPYLIRKITLPILFSIFLIGVTVFSFVVLYRTLINQQRLAAMKNEFMSNITHELKTPIATVGVAIEALRNFGAAQSPERTKEYLDISASELQRLGLLVDKVLKLSLFENSKVELRKEQIDLLELVNEVTNIMKLQFEKNNVVVTTKTSGDNFIMEADRLHITSVIYNLLDNALKYSKENPAIEISLSAQPNAIIEMKVSDNGIGIPKEYKWKVFDKFFRVPSGNMHNIKGYGLGLSYVSEIVKRHMGLIEVESELNKGAAFIIKLPRREADVIHFDDKRKIYRKTIKVDSILKDKQA